MITIFLLTECQQQFSHQSLGDFIVCLSFDSSFISSCSFSVACKQASKSKRFLKRS